MRLCAWMTSARMPQPLTPPSAPLLLLLLLAALSHQHHSPTTASWARTTAVQRGLPPVQLAVLAVHRSTITWRC